MGGQPSGSTTQEHATVVVSRRVLPGFEAPFQEWAVGFEQEMAQFPGHKGCQLISPVMEAQPEWVFVFTFDSAKSLQAWIASETRSRWLARLAPMVEGPDTAQVISGLETLFGLLPPNVAAPPPVWKVAVSVLVGLYPASLLNAHFLAPVLKDLVLPLRVFISVTVLVLAMTWVVMPLVTRLLRPWLYPRP
jgi:antibiotic biosynthesis monooxygenase (ABM) superfamily enzyme